MQLSNIVQDVFASLGLGKMYKLTGGSTTTSIDTTETAGTDEGTIIIVTDAGGLGAAPEGEFARITGFASGTSTWTHDTLTVAPAAGDYAMVCNNDVPLFDMIECVNRGLEKLGYFDLVDTTTLDTASSQTEYAAAVAWKYNKPSQIDIQTNTGDSNDNRWKAITDWEYVPAGANSTGLLILGEQPTASRDLRIWYRGLHPRVSTFSAYIREEIAPELIRQATLLECLNLILSQTGRGVDPQVIQDRNSAAVEFERAKAMFPIRHLPTHSKLLIVGDLGQ